MGGAFTGTSVFCFYFSFLLPFSASYFQVCLSVTNQFMYLFSGTDYSGRVPVTAPLFWPYRFLIFIGHFGSWLTLVRGSWTELQLFWEAPSQAPPFLFFLFFRHLRCKSGSILLGKPCVCFLGLSILVGACRGTWFLIVYIFFYGIFWHHQCNSGSIWLGNYVFVSHDSVIWFVPIIWMACFWNWMAISAALIYGTRQMNEIRQGVLNWSELILGHAVTGTSVLCVLFFIFMAFFGMSSVSQVLFGLGKFCVCFWRLSTLAGCL